MKKLKTFEAKFKTVKSSEMDNWSVDNLLNKDKDKQLTGKKKLDTSLGAKVIELLEEYNLFVEGVGATDWLKKHHIVLNPEKKFKEFRVNLGSKQTFEDWLNFEGHYDYDKMSEEEQDKIEQEYHDSPTDDDNQVEFSVFLPPGTQNLENSAFSDASQYLKLLSESMPEMFKEYLDPRTVLSDNISGFKTFINRKEIKITNDNVEDVTTVEYRLYKDSKFFGRLRDVIGDYESKELINRWLELL